MTRGAPLFTDRAPVPVQDELATGLGPAAARWHELAAAAEAMGGRADWAWAGKSWGWAWRARRSGGSFLELQPRAGEFTALVVLGHRLMDEALELPLGPRARATVEGAHRYPEGCWLYLAVESDEDVRDVLALLRLKLPPTIRARFEAAAAKA